jgi:MFS family permease
VRRVLGIRDVRVYLAGQGLSMLGDSALWLAMGIWVKQLTGSSAAAGITWAAFLAPQLAGPAFGLLADRVRRRPLLLAANLVTALVVLALLFVRGPGDVWLVYVVMAAYGTSNAIMGAAQPALLRTLVPDALLPDANGALQTIGEARRLLAPVAGAGLFAATGAGLVIVLDALTFLVAAASLAAMRLREPAPAPATRHPLAEVSAGIRHVWATPLLRRSLCACWIAVIAFGFSETMLFAVVDAGLHRPPAFVGVLMATQSIAAVLGGIAAAPLLRRAGEPRLCALGLGLFALGCPLLATSRVAGVLGGSLLMGAGIPLTMVGLNTLLQRLTPLGLQGRVYGAVDMLVAVPHVASIAGGAALVASADHRIGLGLMAILLAAGTLPLLTTPGGSRRAARRSPGARPTPAAPPPTHAG